MNRERLGKIREKWHTGYPLTYVEAGEVITDLECVYRYIDERLAECARIKDGLGDAESDSRPYFTGAESSCHGLASVLADEGPKP